MPQESSLLGLEFVFESREILKIPDLMKDSAHGWICGAKTTLLFGPVPLMRPIQFCDEQQGGLGGDLLLLPMVQSDDTYRPIPKHSTEFGKEGDGRFVIRYAVEALREHDDMRRPGWRKHHGKVFDLSECTMAMGTLEFALSAFCFVPSLPSEVESISVFVQGGDLRRLRL